MSTASRNAVQDPEAAQVALRTLRERYEAIDLSPESIAAFQASVDAARAASAGTNEDYRLSVEVFHARGLFLIGSNAQAEAVLRAAIASTQGASRPGALLHLDLAEICLGRRESMSVLDLVARIEAMYRELEGLDRDPEVRSGVLRVRCQTWIDLGRQERVAHAASQLEQMTPSLPVELRAGVALQRGNALLALSAWAPLEKLAAEELADASMPDYDRARWQLRRGRALSEIARLEPTRLAEARHEIEAAVESAQLDAKEHDDGLLALAEIEVREPALRIASARLDELVARHPELASTTRALTAPDAEGLTFDQRAYFESLRIELALALAADRDELASLRTRAHAALDAMRASWLSRPLVPGGQGFLLYGEARLLLGQLARLEIDLEGERVGVERTIEALALLQGAGTAARSLDLGRIDAARLRGELLGADASLLVILPNSLRTHVFVLEPDGAIGSVGAPLERLEVLRGAHARWLFTSPRASSAGRAERMLESAASLRDALFDARVIASLRSRPVAIVMGTDLMGGLPIEALDLAGGRTFGTERGIAHAPSLPLAIALAARSRAPRAPGPWDAVVFGAPEHADSVREQWPQLSPVPLDEADLRGLGAGFAPERVRVLSAHSATVDGLHLPGLESAELLQIVTHGVFDASIDDPAGLVVTPDARVRGVAWRADLRTLAAPKIVALWSCGTQRGPARFGDDTASHLGSAFLEANACCVLVSRADVALEPTLRMARRFARERARGESPAECLRAARAEVADDAATADPFFHAPIVLYGDPGRRGSGISRAAESTTRPRDPEGSGGLAVWVLVAITLVAGAIAVRLFARRSARVCT